MQSRSPQGEEAGTMRTHNSGRISLIERVAAVIVGLEGFGIVALAAWQLAAVFSGDTDSLASALALLVLTLVGAAAVMTFAVTIWRSISWGRSGGVVTQLLILAVALGAVTGSFADPSTGLALAVPGILGLVALVLAIRAAGRRGRSEASE